MSHIASLLPGSLPESRALRACQGGCRRMCSLGGGVEVGSKWICADCWKRRLLKRTRRSVP